MGEGARKPSRVALALGASLAALVLTGVMLKSSPHLSDRPFVWICLAWGSVAVALAMSWPRKPGFHKTALWNCGACLLILSAAELVFSRDRAPKAGNARVQKTYTDLQGEEVKTHVRHGVLGAGNPPGLTARAVAMFGDELVFDVVYSFDENGWRRSAPSSDAPDAQELLFFGGSYMFGEGVQDKETLPSQVGAALGGTYAVQNFGIVGAGPHQMLAAVESGLVAEALHGEPVAAVYLALPYHVSRVLGERPWCKHDPRYVLKNGQAVPAGHFDDPPGGGPVVRKIRNQLEKSHAWQALSTMGHGRVTDREIELTAAVVARAREKLQEAYPSLAFHVLFWDDGGDVSDRLMAAMQTRKLQVHRVSEVLPGPVTGKGSGSYRIPHDGHPGPLAYRLLAEYVAAKIVDGDAGKDH